MSLSRNNIWRIERFLGTLDNEDMKYLRDVLETKLHKHESEKEKAKQTILKVN